MTENITFIPVIRLEKIGAVNNGCDGCDVYYLLTSHEDDLTPEQAIEWLLPKVYRNVGGPGSYYCHTVLAVQAQHSTNKVICTVEERYDV